MNRVTSYFVRSTPISIDSHGFDRHGDVAAPVTMDWWKETARKWFPEFDQRASNITLTLVGDNPWSHGTTQVYVLSFLYTDRAGVAHPEIVQISRNARDYA